MENIFNTSNYLLHELDTFLKLPRKVQEQMWIELRDEKIDKRLFNVAYNFEVYEQCESPIEIIFAFFWDKHYLENKIKADELNLYPQEIITTDNGKNYRVDFEIEFYKVYGNTPETYKEYYSKVVVECDGHEFHEKTKAQVKKRNERDYDLKISGYDVIHFSGSEIYNKPEECIKKVVEYLHKTVRPTSE